VIKVLVVPVDVTEPVSYTEVVPRLDPMRELVGGGYLEVIGSMSHLGVSWCAYCDEEGKLKGLPINQRATHLAKGLGWLTDDVLCGPVFFAGPPDGDGEDTDVPDQLIAVARTFNWLQ
jgi:hypothetical protein